MIGAAEASSPPQRRSSRLGRLRGRRERRTSAPHATYPRHARDVRRHFSCLSHRSACNIRRDGPRRDFPNESNLHSRSRRRGTCLLNATAARRRAANEADRDPRNQRDGRRTDSGGNKRPGSERRGRPGIDFIRLSSTGRRRRMHLAPTVVPNAACDVAHPAAENRRTSWRHPVRLCCGRAAPLTACAQCRDPCGRRSLVNPGAAQY